MEHKGIEIIFEWLGISLSWYFFPLRKYLEWMKTGLRSGMYFIITTCCPLPLGPLSTLLPTNIIKG